MQFEEELVQLQSVATSPYTGTSYYNVENGAINGFYLWVGCPGIVVSTLAKPVHSQSDPGFYRQFLLKKKCTASNN